MPHRINAFQCAALAICTLIVYWAGLHGGFIFDDFPNLVYSDSWKATRLEPGQLLRALHSDISGALGRPLALTSFAVNHAFTGIDPFWLKLTNLLLHCVNGAVVWLLCKQVFTLLPAGPRPSHWAAWVTAAAWLVHPLQVSTTLYVVQRMEIGAATGVLLAVLSYTIARARQLEARTAWPWLLATLPAFAFGMGFKESAMLAPGFALVIEALVFRFRSANASLSRTWLTTWCMLTVAGLAAYLWMVIPQVQHWPVDFRGFGAWERLLTQLPILAMYLQQIVLPLPDSMSFYYDNFPVSRGLFHPPSTAASAALLAGLAGLAIACARRLPLTSVGIAWFFMGHALTSNLWPLELAFEHRNYLALLGILLAFVQPLCLLMKRLSPSAAATAAILPLLCLAALGNLQARTWADPLKLAWTLDNRNPGSARASYGLGTQLLAQAGNDPGSPLWSMAREQFKLATKADSPSVLAIQGLLIMHARAGLQPSPEYWDLLRQGLTQRTLQPEATGVLHALTACQLTGNCQFDPAQMLSTFISVMERNPRNPTAHTLYANFAWNVLKDPTLAIRLQREAVALSPEQPSYRVALAKFLLASGGEQQAQEGRALIQALQLENRAGLLDDALAELEALSEPPSAAGN